MSKSPPAAPSKISTSSPNRNNEPQEIMINVPKGERMGPEMARKLIGPVNRHALLAMQFHGVMAAETAVDDQATIVDYSYAMRERLDQAAAGDLGLVSEVLVAQALSLDGIFTELARRSASNMGQYLDAGERYLRLALKAQAQSRATLEALAKLHQPREQTVRHVHVNGGGQAIVADEFHHHTGGQRNAKAIEQSHGPDISAARGAPLLGQDAPGDGVPVPGDERPEPVPAARRESRRANRKP